MSTLRPNYPSKSEDNVVNALKSQIVFLTAAMQTAEVNLGEKDESIQKLRMKLIESEEMRREMMENDDNGAEANRSLVKAIHERDELIERLRDRLKKIIRDPPLLPVTEPNCVPLILQKPKTDDIEFLKLKIKDLESKSKSQENLISRLKSNITEEHTKVRSLTRNFTEQEFQRTHGDKSEHFLSLQRLKVSRHAFISENESEDPVLRLRNLLANLESPSVQQLADATAAFVSGSAYDARLLTSFIFSTTNTLSQLKEVEALSAAIVLKNKNLKTMVDSLKYKLEASENKIKELEIPSNALKEKESEFKSQIARLKAEVSRIRTIAVSGPGGKKRQANIKEVDMNAINELRNKLQAVESDAKITEGRLNSLRSDYLKLQSKHEKLLINGSKGVSEERQNAIDNSPSIIPKLQNEPSRLLGQVPGRIVRKVKPVWRDDISPPSIYKEHDSNRIDRIVTNDNNSSVTESGKDPLKMSSSSQIAEQHHQSNRTNIRTDTTNNRSEMNNDSNQRLPNPNPKKQISPIHKFQNFPSFYSPTVRESDKFSSPTKASELRQAQHQRELQEIYTQKQSEDNTPFALKHSQPFNRYAKHSVNGSKVQSPISGLRTTTTRTVKDILSSSPSSIKQPYAYNNANHESTTSANKIENLKTKLPSSLPFKPSSFASSKKQNFIQPQNIQMEQQQGVQDTNVARLSSNSAQTKHTFDLDKADLKNNKDENDATNMDATQYVAPLSSLKPSRPSLGSSQTSGQWWKPRSAFTEPIDNNELDTLSRREAGNDLLDDSESVMIIKQDKADEMKEIEENKDKNAEPNQHSKDEDNFQEFPSLVDQSGTFFVKEQVELPLPNVSNAPINSLTSNPSTNIGNDSTKNDNSEEHVLKKKEEITNTSVRRLSIASSTAKNIFSKAPSAVNLPLGNSNLIYNENGLNLKPESKMNHASLGNSAHNLDVVNGSRRSSLASLQDNPPPSHPIVRESSFMQSPIGDAIMLHEAHSLSPLVSASPAASPLPLNTLPSSQTSSNAIHTPSANSSDHAVRRSNVAERRSLIEENSTEAASPIFLPPNRSSSPALSPFPNTFEHQNVHLQASHQHNPSVEEDLDISDMRKSSLDIMASPSEALKEETKVIEEENKKKSPKLSIQEILARRSTSRTVSRELNPKDETAIIDFGEDENAKKTVIFSNQTDSPNLNKDNQNDQRSSAIVDETHESSKNQTVQVLKIDESDENAKVTASKAKNARISISAILSNRRMKNPSGTDENEYIPIVDSTGNEQVKVAVPHDLPESPASPPIGTRSSRRSQMLKSIPNLKGSSSKPLVEEELQNDGDNNLLSLGQSKNASHPHDCLCSQCFKLDTSPPSGLKQKEEDI